MAKKYDLFKSSDMRKLSRDLEKEFKNAAQKSVQKNGFTIECPHCGHKVNVVPGKNVCIYCGNSITVDLNWQ